MKHNYNIAIMLLVTACANIAMPTGGPRDIKPPELVSSIPSNNDRNFSGKTIELTFNEDIKLKDPKEEILIVPTVGKNTLFTVKKKKLIIEPESELQPNTTYSISFRDGVQDLTEGNPAENLRLAFSTGATIDSLSISGRIEEISTEKIPLKITIALYQSDTFDIFKHSPIYFTKSDKRGVFSLSNLKADKYFIYAYDDKNKNLKVDSKTEKFGFLEKPIDPLTNKDSLQIPITQIDSRPPIVTNIRHLDKTSRLRFNKQIDSLRIQGIKPEQSIYSFGTDKSELIFYNKFPKGDSLKTTLSATDSIGQKTDTTFYIKYGELKTIEENFKTKEILQEFSVTTRMFTYTLNYNKPLAKINSDSIYVRYDSLKTTKVEMNNISIDTVNNLITIKSAIEQIESLDKKKPSTPKFVIGKGALITIENDSIKNITKPIKIPIEEDFGTVAVKIETSAKNYIVQITTTSNSVVQSVTNVKDYIFKNLEAMEYRLRIIVDDNKNGKWDPGNFYKRIEPEKIILFKSEEGRYTFPLRANWEYGPVLIKF